MDNFQTNDNNENNQPPTSGETTPATSDANTSDATTSDAATNGADSASGADATATPQAGGAEAGGAEAGGTDTSQAQVSQPQASQLVSEGAGATTGATTADAAGSTPADAGQAGAGAAAQEGATSDQPSATTGATTGASSNGGNTPAEARPSRQPSMAQVMESDEFRNYMSGADALTRGALLRGVVVRADENTGEVLVDIGTKSEGIVTRNELGDEDVNVGDEIEVVVLQPEDDEGHPRLSKRRADYEKTWRLIQQAKDKGTTLEGTVREQVKGGLIVDLGVPAFVPASHVDTRNRGDLDRFVGRTIPLRVIELDRKKNKVIGSHRLAAQEEREKRETEAWANLQKDKIVEGVVRRITDFGAFIDLGGVDGLLHVREMSWGRVDHPENVVKKGQKLQVLILDIDTETKRIALGLKQLLSDPWKKVAKNLRIGQSVTGKVVRIAPSCAFMELEDGVEGIIPISEISEQRIKSPDEVLQVGQEIEARIKQIQTNQRRITLSLRAAVQDRERRETRTAIREVNERSGGGGDDAVRLGDVFGQQLRAARDRGRERNEARAAARARAMDAADAEEWDGDEDVADVAEDADTGVEQDTAAEAASVPVAQAVDGAATEATPAETPTAEAPTTEAITAETNDS